VWQGHWRGHARLQIARTAKATTTALGISQSTTGHVTIINTRHEIVFERHDWQKLPSKVHGRGRIREKKKKARIQSEMNGSSTQSQLIVLGDYRGSSISIAGGNSLEMGK
jgi:hypothetical protein